jgi:hypothetical protein
MPERSGRAPSTFSRAGGRGGGQSADLHAALEPALAPRAWSMKRARGWRLLHLRALRLAYRAPRSSHLRRGLRRGRGGRLRGGGAFREHALRLIRGGEGAPQVSQPLLQHTLAAPVPGAP